MFCKGCANVECDRDVTVEDSAQVGVATSLIVRCQTCNFQYKLVPFMSKFHYENKTQTINS